MKSLHILLLSLLVLLNSPVIKAASLNINPILLSLSQEEPVTTLTLTNLSDKKVTVQADVLAWTQKNGHDIQQPTFDMVISPAVFQVEGQKSQLLRVAWLSKHAIDKQLTYRVILREIVPNKIVIQNPKETNLQIAIAFSIPLFVEPAIKSQRFHWQAKWQRNHQLQLHLQNQGNTTLFLNKIQLSDNHQLLSSKNIFLYLLPMQHHEFAFPLKKTSELNVKAMINGEWNSASVQIQD